MDNDSWLSLEPVSPNPMKCFCTVPMPTHLKRYPRGVSPFSKTAKPAADQHELLELNYAEL
jgi:hypothetical protein